MTPNFKIGLLCSCSSPLPPRACYLVIVKPGKSYVQRKAVVLLKSPSSSLQVLGVPVTIDGDLKNQFVETDVGFDTTCKVRVKSYSVNVVLLVHHIHNRFNTLDVTEDVQVLFIETLFLIQCSSTLTNGDGVVLCCVLA